MKKLLIGTIVNTHGLQGEVKIKPHTHFIDERYAKGSHVWMQIKGKWQELIILSSRMHKDMVLVTFKDYSHIDDVELWKGQKLYVASEILQELEDDEIYYYELYGCTVIDTQGTVLGEVIEVIETGANAVLRVQNQEKSFLVPYVKAFIKDVDKQQKQLTVALVEGIL